MRGGPYAPTNWPPTIDPTKIVHYFVVDGTLAPDPGWTNWTQTLGFASGGDQVVTDTTVCTADVSYTGKKSTSSPGYMNVFDTDWTKWNTNDTIDILVQTYGDVSVFRNNNPANPVRTWRATLGTPAVQQQITFTGAFDTNAFNNRWNWILFRCANNFDPTGINRYCGRATSGTYGGINGGTIRLNAATAQGFLTGVNIHAIAFGEQGAFGEPADINLFDTPIVEVCDPVPNENLVGIDFNAGVTNYLQVMNDLDQTVTYTTSAGPAGDLRKAVIPVGSYLNFGILSNRLGQPCDPKVAMKVCVDFYDDPAFEGQGVQFGPEAYAVDKFGGSCAPNASYPSSGLHAMQGSGQWVRRSWTIGGVNLYGVNVTPRTGGPRFTCIGGQVAVSRLEMAALRTSGPLAGQDPLAGCLVDPRVCAGVYSNYVELHLGTNSLG